MKITKKNVLWGSVFLFIIAAAVVFYYIGKHNGWFAFFESKETIQQYVASFGAWAPVAFFLLQFIQVILSPIPGSVTTIAGGVLFGFFPAFLISTAAVFLGSICAFLLGKLFGRPLVEKLAGKQVIEKYMQTVSSRQKIVLAMMFLLPFFPDDLLCLIAGLSAMRLPYFSVLVIATRPWGLLFSSLLGSGLISIPGWVWIVLIVITVFGIILALKYAPRIEERVKHWLENRFTRKKDVN